MSNVTIREAAGLTGKTRETINKATKNGKLSHTLNSSNHKVIEIAELERVFPLVKTIEEFNQETEAVSDGQGVSESDVNAELITLREKLASTKVMYDTLVAERGREREQLEGQIEDLRDSVKKYQEQHSKALLLITDQSGDSADRIGEWEKSISQLESRLAKQEERSESELERIKRNAQRKIDEQKQALETERAKSFLQKLFG